MIKKLPPPTSLTGVASFLGHVDFYWQSITDFSKIAIPLNQVLIKDVPFEFNEEFECFSHVKRGLNHRPSNAGTRLGATF